MSKGFGKWVYRLTLARWYYNYAWGWVIGYFLSTFSMIVTIYYLIPGLRDLFSFPIFLAGSGILLVGGGWVLGKILVKRFKIQPIENYISSEVNPFTNAALTAKERVYWNAMVVLLKKEHARPPDAEVAKCVEQMNMYIKGKVPFNFDELDNFELGEESEPQGPLTKDAAKWSPPGDIKEGGDTPI
ncbi:hypothetical protein AUH73_02375 [archaeon 13_1_40CM_4_53_4]|nr:MAG: hypothetical protein AUI07_05370 [archaeon 13_2_20CM_2_53_6]OLC63387.1 MAG: hypothetical protein AUH73_02375 [archaeon 13_1_40CM_4_53_4]OLE58681.1 MAG: hypothetical protein AUG17_06585 [Crenarchaeota archaeon 13_1_20CM_2_53_14]TMI27461.1 MAG: hypothetical protein E6H24_01065 [Candidatus Bathyarchaeota archaeon]